MSTLKDLATLVAAGIGILVWATLIIVSLGLPVLAAVYLWKNI